MCSVVGYVGKNYSRDFILEGLSRLEYRGYDSAGFACLHPDESRILYCKAEGRVSNLVQKCLQTHIDGHIGIGHTRWSTHGKPTAANAHPQFDCFQRISIVHNGIIENYYQLKDLLLQEGHTFSSETDTEIIAHLLESLLRTHVSYKSAVIDLVHQLQGAYAFIAIAQDHPGKMLLVRKRSPLCIGLGEGEMFVASDPLAFGGKTKKILFLPDEHFALVGNETIELYDFNGVLQQPEFQDISSDKYDLHKDGHEHYMLKEIYEQKKAIGATVAFLSSISSDIWPRFGVPATQIKHLKKITLVGCGTSWHAARIAQYYFETIAHIPTRVLPASEMRHMPYFPEEDTMCIAISQSGETADTLEAMRLAQHRGITTLALTNVASSTMVREADGFLLTQAGQEIAVASTKAFTTQLTALYWLAHRIAVEKGSDMHVLRTAETDLLVAAQALEDSIENYKRVIQKVLAPTYAQYSRSIFLGRHISYPFAMEAALKLKEISYIFAQCYPAGELKHGPLALVDEQTPVCIFSVQDDEIYKKLVANAQEVKARGGDIVAFSFEGQEELQALAQTSFVFPRVHELLGPIAMSGLMQYFAYEIALVLGCEIDKPRNLAKSVTVE